MRKRAALSACFVLLCAWSLAGCANSIANVLPKNTTPPASAPTSAQPALGSCGAGSPLNHGLIAACVRLGNLSTLDPCSLISVSELPPDLAALPVGRDSLDYCDFAITAGPDKDVTLEVGDLSISGTDGDFGAGVQQLKPEGLVLREGALTNGECDDALQFGGDMIDLGITVYVLQGNGSPSLCDAANEVGKAIGDVINSGTQPQHFTLPRNSIARLAACGLLNNAQVDTYRMPDTPENPSGHVCVWRPDPTSGIQAGVELLIGPKVDTQSGAEPSQIHGLPSYTVKSETSDYTRCEVDTNRIPWGSPGSGLVEIVSVFAAEGPGEIGSACTLASEMADVVWPKLPPLS